MTRGLSPTCTAAGWCVGVTAAGRCSDSSTSEPTGASSAQSRTPCRSGSSTRDEPPACATWRIAMYGGIEAGGTKFVCVIGTGPEDIIETARIAVAAPAETIAASLAFFRRAIDAGVRLEAFGIGSFGPVELREGHPRHGWITSTPKPRWSGTDLIGPVANEFGLPVGFDTDVNAAALAEGRWGAARGLESFIYITLGTGIGGGAVVEGRILHGLGHPEMGHVAVPRRPGDTFAGACPFHGDCFEGMASGPTIAARWPSLRS